MACLLAGCQFHKATPSASYRTDSAKVENLIHVGDSIYARKAAYGDFLQSLELYDSAFYIAQASNDAFLRAKTVYAKGRAYDALNRDPKKTIDFYTHAASLYASIKGKNTDALYIRHLVAHAYDKNGDSVNCVAMLKSLCSEIVTKPDSIKRHLLFTPELALISTVIKNYSLADAILTNLTKRDWIKNDSKEYDYLYHYYVTKARLDIFNEGQNKSPYLDSLEIVFRNSRNFSDSAFYSNELINLYRACNNIEKSTIYESINFRLNEQLSGHNSVQNIQVRLSEMEETSVDNERRQASVLLKTRATIIYLLAALLLAISIFLFFLIRKNREISKKKTELQGINNQLNEKDIQNELLNKEIHHRVKNNLQMILSLVYMQERSTKTQEAKTNLQDIRLRIESVAALHEQLLEQQDEKVNLKQYVTKMVNAVAGLVKNNQHIFTHLEIEPITIPVSKSFPLGQILNEWITNTVKHAAPNGDTLAIYVCIKKENNCIIVHYKDSGQPIPQMAITPKLGLSIIDLLIKQLKGTLKRSAGNYFTYTLTFTPDGE